MGNILEVAISVFIYSALRSAQGTHLHTLRVGVIISEYLVNVGEVVEQVSILCHFGRSVVSIQINFRDE